MTDVIPKRTQDRPAFPSRCYGPSSGVHSRPSTSKRHVTKPKAELNLRPDTCSTKGGVAWTRPDLSEPYEFEAIVDGEVFKEKLYGWKDGFTFPAEPGTWHTVCVKAVAQHSPRHVLAEESIKFRTVFDRKEMLGLLDMASMFVKGREKYQVKEYYRDKRKRYWDEEVKHSIMKPYLKDNNGHEACPINNQISGLFFNCKLRDGAMPADSVFGDVRLRLPIRRLINPRTKMYFADFYCNDTREDRQSRDSPVHYITLVLTVPGSKTDLFCEKFLIAVNLYDNEFLSVRSSAEDSRDLEFWLTSTPGLWVESYYTEDVDVSYGEFSPVAEPTGTSNPGGVPNNACCTVCNLRPEAWEPGKARKRKRESLETTSEAAKRRRMNDNIPQRSVGGAGFPDEDYHSTPMDECLEDEWNENKRDGEADGYSSLAKRAITYAASSSRHRDTSGSSRRYEADPLDPGGFRSSRSAYASSSNGRNAADAGPKTVWDTLAGDVRTKRTKSPAEERFRSTSDWSERRSSSTGARFFYNAKTGASQWAVPDGFSPGRGRWAECRSSTTGQQYFYNFMTACSQWDEPPDFESSGLRAENVPCGDVGMDAIMQAFDIYSDEGVALMGQKLLELSEQHEVNFLRLDMDTAEEKLTRLLKKELCTEYPKNIPRT